MSRIRKRVVSTCAALFLCVGTAGAQGTLWQDLVWPVKMDLVAKDWTQTDVQPWVKVGEVQIWNTREDLTIQIIPGKDPYSGRPLKIKVASIVTANAPDFTEYLDKAGKPNPAVFPLKTDYLGDQGAPAERHTETIPVDHFALCWGSVQHCPNDRYAIVHADLMVEEAPGAYTAILEPAFGGVAPVGATATVSLVTAFVDRKGLPIGWYAVYPFARVQTGHFVDARVRGLTFRTPTQFGTSSESGSFFYIPPERVAFWVGSLPLGSALGDHTVSPVDLFEATDLDDNRVVNVARVLQTLDSNDNPMLIDVTENAHCTDSALASLGVNWIDFSNDVQVDSLLAAMSSACGLTVVSAYDARVHLDEGQQAGNLLKTNISKNGAMPADKAKIEIMPVYIPAKKADGSLTTVVYRDADGNVIETRHEAKPIVVTYEEEVEGAEARDVFIAISRDDGSTWKRTNISKTAGRSSLLTASGPAAPGPGESNKPMLNVKDNLIFVAWTDKYCHGGRPAYAIRTAADRNCDSDGNGSVDGVLQVTHDGETCVPDYPGDDVYYQDDLYGVGGPQRSVLYDPVDWPEMGEVPYSCVWTARGKIEPATGDIVWFKPERITSGRRDAMQLTSAAADGAGVAIAWQEDPKGLRPPEEFGPGDGWSGATVSKKTDIWYSFLKWDDFDKVDTAYAPPDRVDIVDTDGDLSGRVKALVPLSLPVKITDNDVCSLENMLGEGGGGGDGDHELEVTVEEPHEPAGDGSHRYCGEALLLADGTLALKEPTRLCAYTIPITNKNGVTHHVCVAADADPLFGDGRLLDGNSGASRPNLFLQPYPKPDGSKGAWAMLAYEESKGVGIPPEVEGEEEDDRYKPDLGKNVIYHSFDFAVPETVSGGGIINLPETDASGNPVYVLDEFGQLLLDPLGRPTLAYENARRVRLLQQPKGKAGTAQTVLVALYRQGEEGHGKAADIFMRRVTAPKTLSNAVNPYSFDRFVPGAQNLSSVQPGETRVYDVTDPETGRPDTVEKMVNWSWGTENLSDKSGAEAFSDAKAHRGALNGDELIIAYAWTPNWGRKANDKYDLYVRRSWDGGQSWKTDPRGAGPIEHTIVFVDPVTKEETVTITSYAPGALEPPRNVSNLRNNRISLLEPRLVKTPGTITRPDGSLTGYPEDIQNSSIYQVAWGLEVNDPQGLEDELDQLRPFRAPLDIYYGQTTDKGQNFEKVIVTRGDGSGSPEESWNLLAKDRPGQLGAQLKQTPDGSRMYAIWVEQSDGGGDIMFRRVDYRPAR